MTEMSVLACNRVGCVNVMCDDYSHIYGYICRECKEELKSLFPDVSIRDFMDTEPGTFVNENCSRLIDDVFSE